MSTHRIQFDLTMLLSTMVLFSVGLAVSLAPDFAIRLLTWPSPAIGLLFATSGDMEGLLEGIALSALGVVFILVAPASQLWLMSRWSECGSFGRVFVVVHGMFVASYWSAAVGAVVSVVLGIVETAETANAVVWGVSLIVQVLFWSTCAGALVWLATDLAEKHRQACNKTRRRSFHSWAYCLRPRVLLRPPSWTASVAAHVALFEYLVVSTMVIWWRAPAGMPY